MSRAPLTPEQRACLAELAGAPLFLVSRREDGRRIWHYSRTGGALHDGGTILDLGKLGLSETGPNHDDFRITEAGRAWLREEAALQGRGARPGELPL